MAQCCYPAINQVVSSYKKVVPGQPAVETMVLGGGVILLTTFTPGFGCNRELLVEFPANQNQLLGQAV